MNLSTIQKIIEQEQKIHGYICTSAAGDMYYRIVVGRNFIKNHCITIRYISLENVKEKFKT